VPAYRFGGEAEQRYQGQSFDNIESDVRSDYEKSTVAKSMGWTDAREAVHDAYDRTCQLRRQCGTKSCQ
jgi:hypothetical protein